MKLRVTHFWVESKDEAGNETIVGHGQDTETKEIYYLFLNRAKANKLIKDEKKISPEYKYRIVKETKVLEKERWV